MRALWNPIGALSHGRGWAFPDINSSQSHRLIHRPLLSLPLSFFFCRIVILIMSSVTLDRHSSCHVCARPSSRSVILSTSRSQLEADDHGVVGMAYSCICRERERERDIDQSHPRNTPLRSRSVSAAIIIIIIIALFIWCV